MARNDKDTKRPNQTPDAGKRKTKTERSDDWREQTLARVRSLIMQTDPRIIEETKWRKPSNPAGVPVWSREGILCTGETYKAKVKLTFAKGARVRDPTGLFNAGLEGNTRRAIDTIRDGGN